MAFIVSDIRTNKAPDKLPIMTKLTEWEGAMYSLYSASCGCVLLQSSQAIA